MVDMTIRNEYTLTDLLRSPKVVTEATDRVSQLVIHRRNAPDLLLMRADRQHWVFEGAQAVARLLTATWIHLGAEDSIPALDEAMPWTVYLSEAGRAEFFAELSKALLASAELNNFAPVGQVLSEWKATAAIRVDPELADVLTRPIEAPTGENVPEP